MSETGSRPRKAILGGTFNPPHVAHLIVAGEVAASLDLDQVLLIPTATHAFKGEAEASALDRARMTELAVAGDPRLSADRLEVQRGGTSFTVDTLESLHEREPETKWYLIIGRDLLDELDEWKDAERLPDLAEVVVVTRGAAPGDEPAPRLPFGGECTLVPVPALEISSTAIRRRVAEGKSIRYWVTPAVEAYVREKKLYGGDE
ncbi:MAG: nicotinate-nucleotide adenylyltransferase [Gemmatimonadota bacterium]|nr:nicotinate-nucleotide adenylyltransferase [Gemmatimonadota bacterium]